MAEHHHLFSSNRPALDEETLRHIGEVFRAYDVEQRGALTRHGVKCAVTCLTGAPPTRLELDAIVPKRSEGEPEPTLGMEAFTSVMRERLGAVDEADVIRQTFRAFDTAFKGFVTFDDFARAFALTAPHTSADTLRLVFDEVDTDRNGKVSWGDFERMMRSRAHRVGAPAGLGAAAGRPADGRPFLRSSRALR